MKRFSYLRDPLFLICCTLYIVARWAIKPHLHLPFVHDWLTDILLIPCAIPPLLWVHRCLKIRSSDGPPSAREIAIHLFGWSILFEGIGPHLLHRGTSDLLDLVAYSTGAIIAFLWWNRDVFLAGELRTNEL